MIGLPASRASRRRMPYVLAGVVYVTLAAGPLWLAPSARAQVFTVTPEGVNSHYLEFHATHVQLSSQPLTERTRQDLVRVLDAEQGFAMRPLPRGSHGLDLHANGNLNPAGSDYVRSLQEHGVSAKPGDRCVISDVRIKGNRMVFDLNGGPDKKHKFLRHISIGTDPYYTTPVVQDNGIEPTGARITLIFEGGVPEMTGDQVRALLQPLLGFGLKSPVQAYTDTLPPQLKQAILNHQVLVGMNTEMVIYALGQPTSKIREVEGNMPFEEWIYGEPPHDVTFVRINGNRVIRVETAKVGQSPVIHAENEVGDYWSTQPDPNIHEVKLGDQSSNDQKEQRAPAAAPSLRNPGETLPQDKDMNTPTMKKVQFPKDQEKGSDPSPSAVPQQPRPASASQPAQPAGQPGSTAQPDPSQPSSPPAPAASSTSTAAPNQVLPSRSGGSTQR
jgi:hypothetical protein